VWDMLWAVTISGLPITISGMDCWPAFAFGPLPNAAKANPSGEWLAGWLGVAGCSSRAVLMWHVA
jgi:hypothetical protein